VLDNRHLVMINGVAVVAAPAEIDIVNAEQLRTVLREAGRLGHARIVVDMTATRFCDSEGFSVLVGAQKWALAEGGGLRLVIPVGSPVLRIFRVIGLGRFIRAHWFGVVICATPRLGVLGRGITIPWRVIAALIIAQQPRGC
jgi:anti-sigma B factor antagonist